MKYVRIVIGLFLILTFLFAIRPAVSHASSEESSSSLLSSDTDTNVPQNLHSQTQTVLIETMSAFICQLSGIDVIDPQHGCLGINTKIGKIGYVPQQNGGGAIGFVGNLIGSTFTVPVSTHQYISYLSSNFGLTKSANAQVTTTQPGVGLQGLAPVFRLWEAFRNIVYFIFVILLVMVGLGIMFRVQIDPRTVMTIQNQIPRIIIGLILVSVSYAIAGLLIDLMWVFIYILFSIFAVMKPELNGLLSNLYNTPFGFADHLPVTATIPILGGTVGGLAGIALNASLAIGDIIKNIISGGVHASTIGRVFGILTIIPLGILPWGGCMLSGTHISLLGGISTPDAFNCVDQASGVVLGSIGGIIAFLIICVAILASLLRLWFQLLKSYVIILVDVIFAPFWIVLGLLPGSSISFGAWLRDIAANLMVYPATVLMFLMAYVVITSFSDTTNPFVPPLVGNPFGSSTSPTIIASLIGVGIILMTPQVTAMVRDALKAPGFRHMASIGTMTGLGGAIVGSTVGGAWGRAWRRDSYGNATGWMSSYVGNRIVSGPRNLFERVTSVPVRAIGSLTGIKRPYTPSGSPVPGHPPTPPGQNPNAANTTTTPSSAGKSDNSGGGDTTGGSTTTS